MKIPEESAYNLPAWLNETRVNDSDNEAQLAVRDIMSVNPVSVIPDMPVKDAAALMSGKHIGAVVVCVDGGIVGILTERDLLRCAARAGHSEDLTVAELMTASPFTVDVDATWAAAADLMQQHGVRHLPVVERDKLVGMLSMRDLMERRNRHLDWLVRQRTAELEEKNAALDQRDRLMQYHLQVAGEIQQRLLPPGPPSLPGFIFGVMYRPLERVSGDYYDFALLPSGRLGILLADASGHSVPAAFVSVMAKMAFHAFAGGIESPAVVLKTMNQQLANLLETGRFISMFYGVLDPGTRRLVYALAGHPRPLWYNRQTNDVTGLDADGPLIGLLSVAAFEQRSVELSAGDTVLIYTDGVSECRNDQGEQFGQQRLEHLLEANVGRDVIALLETELARFRNGEPFHDDVTCISLSAGSRLRQTWGVANH
jgi:sigma-B regulation protein RsbU (phosphoserine phosphatase)